MQSSRIASPRLRAGLLARRLAGFSIAWLASAAAPALALGFDPSPLLVEPDPPICCVAQGKGWARFIGMVQGVPAGGSVGLGSVAPTDLSFVFEFEAALGIPAIVGSLLIGETPYVESGQPDLAWTGAGWIPGPNSDVFPFALSGGTADFQIGLLPGATTDRLFVSIPTAAPGDTAELAVVPHGFIGVGVWTVVPEPASVWLLAAGLVALGARRR